MNNEAPSPECLKQLLLSASAHDVEIITAKDEPFENARLVYNRMHDKHPAIILRSLNPTIIGEAINIAKKYNIPFAIRSGGHHVAGFSTCEGGILLDFSTHNAVSYDQTSEILSVQPGARLRDLDAALSSINRMLPLGTVSDTGISGLALSGGIGWLEGVYGLTCDHIVGGELITADGRVVEISSDEELLWAIRGGGGNFGIVTRFDFITRPKLCVTFGSARFPSRVGAAAIISLANYVEQNGLTCVTLAPTISAKQKEADVSVDFCIATIDAGDGRNVLRGLMRVFEGGYWDTISDGCYKSWQSQFDDFFFPPMRGYWKSIYSKDLRVSQVQALIEHCSWQPKVSRTILIEHLHGAFQVGESTSSFPLRAAKFGIMISSRWKEEALDKSEIGWARKLAAMHHDSCPNPVGAYSNYSMQDECNLMDDCSPSRADRLRKVKERYDAKNFFLRNHNINVKQRPERTL